MDNINEEKIKIFRYIFELMKDETYSSEKILKITNSKLKELNKKKILNKEDHKLLSEMVILEITSNLMIREPMIAFIKNNTGLKQNKKAYHAFIGGLFPDNITSITIDPRMLRVDAQALLMWNSIAHKKGFKKVFDDEMFSIMENLNLDKQDTEKVLKDSNLDIKDPLNIRKALEDIREALGEYIAQFKFVQELNETKKKNINQFVKSPKRTSSKEFQKFEGSKIENENKIEQIIIDEGLAKEKLYNLYIKLEKLGILDKIPDEYKYDIIAVASGTRNKKMKKSRKMRKSKKSHIKSHKKSRKSRKSRKMKKSRKIKKSKKSKKSRIKSTRKSRKSSQFSTR